MIGYYAEADGERVAAGVLPQAKWTTADYADVTDGRIKN
jgi:hypothetical protein